MVVTSKILIIKLVEESWSKQDKKYNNDTKKLIYDNQASAKKLIDDYWFNDGPFKLLFTSRSIDDIRSKAKRVNNDDDGIIHFDDYGIISFAISKWVMKKLLDEILSNDDKWEAKVLVVSKIVTADRLLMKSIEESSFN